MIVLGCFVLDLREYTANGIAVLVCFGLICLLVRCVIRLREAVSLVELFQKQIKVLGEDAREFRSKYYLDSKRNTDCDKELRKVVAALQEELQTIATEQHELQESFGMHVGNNLEEFRGLRKGLTKEREYRVNSLELARSVRTKKEDEIRRELRELARRFEAEIEKSGDFERFNKLMVELNRVVSAFPAKTKMPEEG